MRSFRVLLVTLSVVLFPIFAMAQSAPQAARDYVYGPRGKLAATIEPDGYPPDPPGSVSTSFAPGPCGSIGGTVTIEWTAATDIGSGVSVYKVYRDGSPIGEFSGLSTTDYVENPTSGYIEFNYTVTAIDFAGHEGDGASSLIEIPPPCELDDTLFALLRSRWGVHQLWAAKDVGFLTRAHKADGANRRRLSRRNSVLIPIGDRRIRVDRYPLLIGAMPRVMPRPLAREAGGGQ
jgi:hypothetical protein